MRCPHNHIMQHAAKAKPYSLVGSDESSVSSEEFDMSDPTWISTERHSAHSDLNPATNMERMLSPQNTHKEDDVSLSVLTWSHLNLNRNYLTPYGEERSNGL
ncbi:nucleolar protein 4-like b isoform X1 [Tachysurus ichikawai]